MLCDVVRHRRRQEIPTFAYLPVTILPVRFYYKRHARFVFVFHHLFLDKCNYFSLFLGFVKSEYCNSICLRFSYRKRVMRDSSV